MKHVIIGVGAAGMTAAATIRECSPSAEIVMISSDAHVHSRCMLHKYLSHERDEETLNFVPADFFEKKRITWLKEKRVEAVEPGQKQVRLADGTLVSYDKLLIATGADSVIPPIGDFKNAKNVFGLRNLSDAQAIDRLAKDASEVLVVGSGLVGMDAAYALLERGKKVTVVEMAERILPLQLDETAGKPYQEAFEAHGCRFLLGKKAAGTRMDGNGRITSVSLDDGTEIPCDLIIVAAGVRPAIACAAAGGLQGERFIETDDSMKTSQEDVYAAGDVTGRSGIWPNAMKQGQIAAYNMCGFRMEYVDTYAMKNTMNFYGITTLSLGRGTPQEGDEVLVMEDHKTYKKAIIRDGRLDSILLQGDIDYSGIYQYLVKNQVDVSDKKDRIFDLSFADFYGITEDGHYDYQI